MTRWILLLQEFNITIIDKPGKQNVVDDFLSRINIDSDVSPINDYFPNEHLFVVSTHTQWFVNKSNYLATGKLPNHLSSYQKRKIIQ